MDNARSLCCLDSSPSVPTMKSDSQSAPVAVVGAGSVGTVLARRLVACGYQVEAVLSRTKEAARDLADRVGASIGAQVGHRLPPSVRFVVLCVPDDAIPAVANRLSILDHSWAQTIVAHTSGVRTAAALEALAQEGAAVLSFHPLQTFTPGTPPDAFEGIAIGLEGDDRAVAAGEVLAQALGAHPTRLTAEEKTRYHCAATLASNGLVALTAVVEEVFGTANVGGSDRPSATDLVAPLVEQTWSNLKRGAPEGALTGPVARGDTATVQAHLDALSEAASHLVPLYVALSTEMVRVAVRGGKLDRNQAEELLATLRDAAETEVDDESPSSPPL